MVSIFLDLLELIWIFSSGRSDCKIRVVFLLISVFSKILLSTLGFEKNVLVYNPQQKLAKLHRVTWEYPSGVPVNLVFSHAESPVYDPESHTLYWVDVLNQNIHAWDYITFEHRIKYISYGEVNVVVPVANSSRLLVGCRSQLFLMDWERPGDSALKLVATLDPLKSGNVLNEGKADPVGRFWGGTKGPQRGDDVVPDQGALYSVQRPHYTPEVQLEPVTISNGLVWAPNNSLLYYIDSATNKIEAFDFDVLRGQISNRRTILDLTDWGFDNPCPDGMTIDRDGLLWIALHVNGSIIRVDPDRGRIVRLYELPVCRTTSLAWAGPALEDLVVSTSRRNVAARLVAAAPLSGALLVLRTLGTGGLPHHKFAFDGADIY